MMKRLFWLFLAPLILCTTLTGCGSDGPEMETVTGEVLVAGEPIEEGRIIFRKTEGDKRAFSGAITAGKYSFESEAGKMQVEITANREVPGKFDTSNPGEKVPIIANYIPAKYNSRTELTAEVSDEKTQFDFELDAK